MFTVADYDTLVQILTRYQMIIATIPNILTEVSNLSEKVSGDRRQKYFASFADQISTFVENYIPSRDAATSSAFNMLGLSDAAITEAAAQNLLVVTIDLQLYLHLANVGFDVVNFNHISPFSWA